MSPVGTLLGRGSSGNFSISEFIQPGAISARVQPLLLFFT